MTHTNKLRAKMIYKDLTREDMAKALNINKETYSRKMNNLYDFTQTEIMEISKLLGLTNAEVMDIFMN